MKTPTIEEVIEHFKDAEIVSGLINNFDISKCLHTLDYSDKQYWVNDDGSYRVVWNKQLGYCKIISYKKYDLSKLTQEHIQELIKEPNIHEMFVRIGVVKNEIPYGVWVLDDNFPKWMLLCNKENAYGFNGEGDWININSHINPNLCNRHRIATPEEVTKRLIEYAKETYKGKTAKCLHRCLDFDYEKHYKSFRYDGFALRYEDNSGVGCLFEANSGKWSEPIQPETYIKIPLSEIKATPNYYSLGALVVKKMD